MTDAQRQLWERAHRRVSNLQPDVAAAVLAAFRIISAGLSEAEIARLITAGDVERIVTVTLSAALLDRATQPLRQSLRRTVETSFRLNTPYLPRGGKIDGTVAIFFDRLNPRVIEALRTLETRAVEGLQESVRETVRQTISRGLQEQTPYRTIAQRVGESIGLSPRGEGAVDNFRKMLETGDREALSRTLRDKRFDKTLDRALGKDGTGLSAEQIERMTATYRKRSIAYHAESVSRDATLDAYKLAQRESWISAIEKGIVDAGSLMRQWIGLDDGREREAHLRMNNEIVSADSAYSNGQRYAGEGDHGCRCLDRYFVARAA